MSFVKDGPGMPTLHATLIPCDAEPWALVHVYIPTIYTYRVHSIVYIKELTQQLRNDTNAIKTIYLGGWFYSTFTCWCLWSICSEVFWIFLKQVHFPNFLHNFWIFLNMGPYGSEHFKTLLLLQLSFCNWTFVTNSWWWSLYHIMVSWLTFTHLGVLCFIYLSSHSDWLTAMFVSIVTGEVSRACT